MCGFSLVPRSEGNYFGLDKEVAGAMESGAFGLSTGVDYLPGKFADNDEIAGMAVLEGFNQIWMIELPDANNGANPNPLTT